jgi:hypothetical protein
MPILDARYDQDYIMSSDTFGDIPYLVLNLPAATPIQTTAFITLCIGQPFAKKKNPSGNFPGGDFAIAVDGQVQAIAGFTYESKNPASSSRHPVTLVVAVKLTNQLKQVTGQVRRVGGAEVHTGGYTSLTAVLG